MAAARKPAPPAPSPTISRPGPIPAIISSIRMAKPIGTFHHDGPHAGRPGPGPHCCWRLTPAHAAPTTVHCTAPGSAAERLVCTKPTLLQQDQALALVYQGAEARFDNGGPRQRRRAGGSAPKPAGLDRRARPLHRCWLPKGALRGAAGHPGLPSPLAPIRPRGPARRRIHPTGGPDRIRASPGRSHAADRGHRRGTDGVELVSAISTGSAQSKPMAASPVRDPTQPGTILTIHRTQTGLDIPDTPVNRATSEASCGANGSLLWPYTRKPTGT